MIPKMNGGTALAFHQSSWQNIRRSLRGRNQAFFLQAGRQPTSTLISPESDCHPTSKMHRRQPQSSHYSNASYIEEALPKDKGTPGGSQAGGQNLQGNPEVEQENYAGDKQGISLSSSPVHLLKTLKLIMNREQ